MNRTDRLYAVREELRRAGARGRTAKQLADTFEISTRTVKRDISALQAAGFPVWSRAGRTGGYVVDAEATLPPITLTPAEVSGLAVALAGQRALPFNAEARTALLKVLAVTSATTRRRAERLAERVWIDHAHEPSLDIPAVVRKVVEDALAEQRVLHLHYRDANGDTSDRLVDPQLLARTTDSWYLVAHCRSRNGIRWFRLDRIITARLVAGTSVDRPVAAIGTPPATAHPASEVA